MRLLLVYGLAMLAAVLFCSEPDVVAQVINADLIKPAALAHDVWQAGHAEMFQLSRAPGLVPDLVAYVALSGVFPAWRMTAVAYAAVSFLGLVAALGAVVAQLARCRLAEATGWVLALSIAAMGADIVWFGSMHPTLLIFTPDIHSGPLVLAFAGLLMVAAWLERPWIGWEAGLFVLSAAGTLSDRLFVGTFVLPALAGLALLVLSRSLVWRRGLRVAIVLAVGCLVGTRIDHTLFEHVLMRQGDVPLGSLGRHLGLLMRSPTLGRVVAIEAVLVGMAALGWRWFGTGVFWVGAFLAMTGGHLALYAALYTDDALLRYVQPVFWWGVVWVAAGAVRVPWRAAAYAAAGLAVAVLLRVENGRAAPIPGLLAWQLPLAACLREAHGAGRLHEGLAGYWLARPIEVATDWTMQVDQITGDGRVLVWGNNRFRYNHSRADAGQAPLTDFIVMDQLDAAAIRARFGPPVALLQCPGSEVWMYGASVHDRVGGIRTADQRNPAVLTDLCLDPRDFRTDDSGTRGPFLTLGAGQWRIRVRYRSETPGRWDAFGNIDHVYAAGDLPAEQQGLLEAAVELPKAVQGFDLRFSPAQGFALASVSLMREGSVSLMREGSVSLMREGSVRDPCP